MKIFQDSSDFFGLVLPQICKSNQKRGKNNKFINFKTMYVKVGSIKKINQPIL